MYSVETRSLSKTFGTVKAVNDISFAVESGEIFGFLGPNGAGKSTTIMILTTLLQPTSGKALVSGFDVMTHAKQVRQVSDMYNKNLQSMNICQDEKIYYYKQDSIISQKIKSIRESTKFWN